MCAALLTSQVKFKLSTYRTKHWLKKAIVNVSPKKYHGMKVGRKKQNRIFIRMKCLWKMDKVEEMVNSAL